MEAVSYGDSAAGIETTHRGGIKAIGIGHASCLAEADMVLSGLEGYPVETFV